MDVVSRRNRENRRNFEAWDGIEELCGDRGQEISDFPAI